MDSPSPAQARRSLRPLIALGAAVALLHWLAWDSVAHGFTATAAPAANHPPVQVRSVPPKAREDAPAIAALAAPPAAVAATKPAPVPKPAPRRQPAAPAPTATASAAPEPAAPSAGSAAATSTGSAVTATLSGSGAAAQLTPVADITQSDIPVYRTKVPPAMTLGYELHYGRWVGSGELHWRPNGSSYEARLEGRVAMMKVITLESRGGFDDAGLAPTRYTDQRRGRGEQAANFQRKAGKITFSGHQVEYPLLEGSQDRLSWMLQLAAIAQANPKRVGHGGRIVLHVVGARGDSDMWAFHVEANEEVSTPDGSMKAVKLVREPRKPHDTRVEVWLAPSLHYLPVRARQTTEKSSWDLRLLNAQAAT